MIICAFACNCVGSKLAVLEAHDWSFSDSADNEMPLCLFRGRHHTQSGSRVAAKVGTGAAEQRQAHQAALQERWSGQSEDIIADREPAGACTAAQGLGAASAPPGTGRGTALQTQPGPRMMILLRG